MLRFNENKIPYLKMLEITIYIFILLKNKFEIEEIAKQTTIAVSVEPVLILLKSGPVLS
jgi:hypothetical protein